MLRQVQNRVRLKHFFRDFAGEVYQPHICQRCHPELVETRLSRAKKVARTPFPQVLFRQHKAIIGLCHNEQPLIFSRIFGFRDQNTRRRRVASPR